MRVKRKTDPNIGVRAAQELSRLYPMKKQADQAMGCGKHLIYEWQSGIAPSALSLQRLAELGADIDYILRGKRTGGMNTLLNYPGAKWGMAKMIVNLMPQHRSYLEPYFGSGAVLFNKPPSAIETVNDIDGDIVNFFRILREQPDELAEALALTPYARDVFDDAHENRGSSDFDRAYRFAVRSKMGHGFKTYQKTGFKIDISARENSYAVKCWNRLPGDLLKVAVRLKDVQIEHRPALDLIRKFNHDNVLIYADPPYLLNTRGGKQYRHEMTEQDHVELLDALKQHKGSVILSGYPSEMYDRDLAGWNRITKKSYNRNADQRTEVLWCNFEVPGLFEMEGMV